MLKCKLTFGALSSTRNIATSFALRNLEEEPQRYNQEVPSFKPLSHFRAKQIEEDKKKLQWRNKLTELPGFYKSKLSVFSSEEEGRRPSQLEMIAQPIDLSIKRWWANYKVRRDRFLQQFIPERHAILGNDLAAAHFLLFRLGKIKFVGKSEWMEIKEEEPEDIPLPKKFDPTYELEAIKCDNMNLYYEGLDNLRRLKKLKYLSFRNVVLFDDWGMDRISGSEFISLETLDIRGTNVTANGLQALYRIPTLKKLVVDKQPEENICWHLTVAMLIDILPDLEVVESDSD